MNTGGGWVIETFKFFVNVNLVMACILVVTVGKDKQEGEWGELIFKIKGKC